MSIPSVYINLEDDVSKIIIRLKHQSSKQVVLVCPKRCFLFNDSINLRLLKKQVDLLGKEVFILTMDERGQLYAKEAGFELKHLPKAASSKAFSDIRLPSQVRVNAREPSSKSPLSGLAAEIKNAAQTILPAKIFGRQDDAAPKIASDIKLQEPKVEVKETEFPRELPGPQKFEAKKSHTGKVITGIVAASLILVLFLVFVVLPKAEVVVYPKTEPVTRDMEISISINAKGLDPDKLVMPALAVNETVNVSAKFESQGKTQVGNKASGTVKIYNFTKLPINLKAATTVLSVGGKTYNLVNDVLGLKPAVYKNAKTKEVDPASLGDPVEIIAVNGGDDSNLPAGTRLEISNQVFGSRPLLLYAKTDSEINGGTTRYLSVISQDDLAKSKAELQAKALRTVREKLAPAGAVLADGAFVENLSQLTTDNPLGTQTPSFQASLEEGILGLSFRRADLDGLIFQRIGQTMDTNKTLEQSSPDQTVYKVKSLDLNNGLAVLEVHFEGRAVFNIDLQNIAPQLTGKSQTQVNEILRSKAAIDRVDITLAPSWQIFFPFFAAKIKVSTSTQPE